jgi:arylformamidase
MSLIDLSVIVNEHTPVYPGDPTVKIEQVGVLDRDGYIDHIVSMDTHTGTHIDAPLHMLKDGKSLDKFSPDKFVGRGRYVNVSEGFNIDILVQAKIEEGDIVLFHTGMSDHFYESAYYESYPAMSEEIAQYLIEHKVKMVGLDTGSADNVDGFPIHKLLLGADILIIENVSNLDTLAGKDFTVYALPMKLQLDGSPARVFAELN